MSGDSRDQNDWLSSRRRSMIAWGVPATAMVAIAFLDPSLRTLVWPLSLVWMGTACLANARRCGRVHCFCTGPLFLILAAAALLHGLDVLSLGAHGWTWLGTATAVGGGAVWLISEGVWGRYVAAKRNGTGQQ